MSRIKNKDTEIEIRVRKYLFHHGFRYRKNVSSLPGKPDIILPKYGIALFVHGCFWHRHQGCKLATVPKTRTEFWMNKFKNNVEKDKKNYEMLEQLGWTVIIIWECEVENNFEHTMNTLIADIYKSGKIKK